jgi:HK97 family phage major capsid protein
MSQLLELKKQHADTLAKAEGFIAAIERQKRPLSTAENTIVNGHMMHANRLKAEIAKAEDAQVAKVKALRALIPAAPLHVMRPGSGEQLVPKKFLAEYASDFYSYLKSFGKEKMSASLGEAVDAAGGYAAPITVDDQIVPLAPQDLAVRRLSTVISTKSDRLIPQKSSFGSAALRTETSAFAGSVPALSQISLGAHMAGTFAACSLEILQDVPEFEAFVLDDISLDIQQLEESWFVNGTGSGQAQGLIGNVGAGVTEEPDSNGNLVSINGTLDLIGSLNSMYYANASWLLSRATAIGIRKAQLTGSVYEPVWSRVGNQDFLHGFPVAFSESMPTAARGAAPVLFGDFKRAYIIGDRGGSAVRLKVVDQGPLAAQGIVGLIGYRRTDGRVRRSEAIQQYNVAAS